VSAGRPSGRGAVRWLTLQAILFGAAAALLAITANAMFLNAYGSGWLPVTYIAIGVVGVVVSGAIAQSAQRFDLVRMAVVVLGGAAALFGLSWVIATGADGTWVSAPLLVLFPILIQLGFVFVGGQAGRILDIAGIKASFPRIMTGFPVGAVIGGVLAVPLVDLSGRTEDLLLATAIVQASFMALVWATGRRYAALLVLPPAPPATAPGANTGPPDRSSLRVLFGQRFVALILAYQVLSALGSQLADFLVFDRATAQFPAAEDLARFVAGYMAIMNAVSIAFLFLVAGPLLRRYGLKLGIPANPLVVTVFAGLMIVVLAAAGGGSVALLAVVSAARIADIALTDGTTRTSINAMYQVLPQRSRLAAQAAVEGMGVPVAIGVSGVVLLVLNALPGSLAAMIAILAVVCAAWTWTGVLLYRAYGPALVDALRRRRLLDPDAEMDATVEDAHVARRLLVSGDARSARFGLELASTLSASPGLGPELAALADDPDVRVRLSAMAVLGASGDGTARGRLPSEVRAAAASADETMRLMGALVMRVLDRDDRAAVARLLMDEALPVRSAALESVQPGDEFAVEPVVDALGDSRVAPAAMGAADRLGDAVLPALVTVLEAPDALATPATARLVRSVRTPGTTRDGILEAHVGHRDRELGLLVMERLAGPGPASPAGAAALDAVLREDRDHAVRILRALLALAPAPDGASAAESSGADGPLRQALIEELALVRQRIIAGRIARHGSEHLGPAITRVAAEGAGAALAVEAVEVAVGSDASRLLVPLLDPTLLPEHRLALLVPPGAPAAGPDDAPGWLRDLVEDAEDHWRSAWLRACAIRVARAQGLLAGIDLAAARMQGDPVVDEELALAAVTA
jgi:hypothetical protein